MPPASSLGVPAKLPDGRSNPEYQKRWYHANREKVRARGRAQYYRNKTRGVSVHEYRKMVVNLLHERDGDICSICHERMELDDVQIDHILQRAIGGTHDADNLRIVHAACNRARPKPRSNA